MTHAPGRTAPAAFTDMSTPGSERSGTTMSVSVKQGGHTSSTIPDEETNVTTTNIYIASPEGANGRNVVAYGVLKALTTKFKTAVFRPAVSNHDHFTPILLNASNAGLGVALSTGLDIHQVRKDKEGSRGDIVAAFNDAMNVSRADAALIGRGSFGNPWLFAQGNALLAGEKVPPLPPLRARMEEALGQITTACSLKGEKIAILEARKQLCWYLRGVSHAGYYKQQIVSMNTLADAEKIVRGIQRDLR